VLHAVLISVCTLQSNDLTRAQTQFYYNQELGTLRMPQKGHQTSKAECC